MPLLPDIFLNYACTLVPGYSFSKTLTICLP